MNQNQIKEQELSKLGNELKKVKKTLSALKEQRDQIDKENQKLKQKTGIVRTSALRDEHDNRGKELNMLEAENKQLEERHNALLELIKEARLEEQKQNFEM